MRLITIALVTAALTAACANQIGSEDSSPDVIETTAPSDATTSSPHRGTTPKPERVPEGGSPVVGEVPQEILNPILEDAATRFEVDPSALEVIRSEQVLWNDGSLGCPEPGEFYTQALVDGYWVVVEHADQQLDYRVTAEGTWRLCESAQPEPPSG